MSLTRLCLSGKLDSYQCYLLFIVCFLADDSRWVEVCDWTATFLIFAISLKFCTSFHVSQSILHLGLHSTFCSQFYILHPFIKNYRCKTLFQLLLKKHCKTTLVFYQSLIIVYLTENKLNPHAKQFTAAACMFDSTGVADHPLGGRGSRIWWLSPRFPDCQVSSEELMNVSQWLELQGLHICSECGQARAPCERVEFIWLNHAHASSSWNFTFGKAPLSLSIAILKDLFAIS